jgi:hypothetical protein
LRYRNRVRANLEDAIEYEGEQYGRKVDGLWNESGENMEQYGRLKPDVEAIWKACGENVE